MPLRTQIPTNQVGDGEIFTEDLSPGVLYRAEGIQYPVVETLEVGIEARLIRAECLIIKPTGKVIIQPGGRVLIRR